VGDRGTISCELACPEDWIPLPLDAGIDLDGWARERAAALDGTSALARELRGRAADSLGRRPVLAYALCPRGLDAVLAHLEVDVIHPDPTVPEISLDWLTELFSTADFGAPEVVRATLPAGPAVRIGQSLVAGGLGPGGERTVLETLAYGVLPPGLGSAVVVLVSWTVPGLGEAVTGVADAVVGSLSVRDDG
jgi:hypothetical protein